MTVLHENLALLETNSSQELDLLLTYPQVAQFTLVRISECALLIDPAQAQALLASLKKLGYTPKTITPREL